MLRTDDISTKRTFLDRQITTRELLFILLVVVCLTPLITPPIALLLGFLVAQFIGHPFLHLNQKATHILLQISVVGLGFGVNVNTAMKAGKEGVLFTLISIIGTLLLGALLGKLLNIERNTAHLISCGTAICGGSAIAAISPVIQAKEKQISAALGTVFILNSLALFVFPLLGHYFNLSQSQFGLWCAIAIHDTSSVVGAASKYGIQALEVATTVKLARALWIIPVAFGTSVLFRNKATKIKIPYFIILFVIAMLLSSYIKAMSMITPFLITAAKIGLTLTLFLIGAGLNRTLLNSVGFRPFLQGMVLWIAISVTSLWAVMHLT